jgi:hypothetical protein
MRSELVEYEGARGGEITAWDGKAALCEDIHVPQILHVRGLGTLGRGLACEGGRAERGTGGSRLGDGDAEAALVIEAGISSSYMVSIGCASQAKDGSASLVRAGQ